MARNQNRRQIVAQAIQARRPGRSGGTTAPRSAAKGPRLGQNHPAHGRIGLGGAKPVAGPGVIAGGGAGGGAAPVAYKPTPWNSKAEEIVNAARRGYLGSQTNFDLAEQEAKQDYGLDQGFNDYKANPYSRAALLEQSYQNANRGTMNSAGLQLYSGSTSNALGSNRSTLDLNRNNLANSYREALGEITAGRTKAAEEKAEKERQAEWERIEAAEAQEPEGEASPPGGGQGGGSGGGGGKKAKGKSKGGGGGKGPAIAPRRKAR